MTDFNPADFGLPGGDTATGFMYDDSALAVDVNDPIYKQVAAAMEADAKARGVEPPPLPGQAPRPPVLVPNKEGSDDSSAPSANDDQQPVSPPASGNDPVVPPATTTDDQQQQQPDTFALKIDGQDFAVNAEQVEYLLRVNSWLEATPDETKQAWAAIEQGTAVAVSVEELTRLRAAAAAATQKPATPPPPNVDDLDDDVAEYIRSLEARVAPASQVPGVDAPGQPQIPVSDLAAAAQRQAERGMQMRQELAQVNAQWQEAWGLNEAQMARVTQVATELAVVPNITRQRTQYSHTGAIIKEPAFSDVVREAYEVAMNADPTLRAIRDEVIYNQRVAHDAQVNAGANAKKAKAGSLAATPSAAVPATGAVPKIGPDNRMNLQETSNAIAKAIAEIQKQD